jgi:hypothetical protein
VKVYLSSTFRDLREHRAAVDRTLRRMGHDVIGMEQYAAEGSRPVDRCKRDVEAADSYVLILGWRYGYVPTEGNPKKLSITEIEYRHALENKKTVLAFLLDPETPWPPSAMDSASADAAAAVAISRLRTEVGWEFLAGIFSSPGDLASQVAAAVASQGMTTSLSELVLNRSDVNAASMGGFGTGGQLYDTSVLAINEMIRDAGTDRAIVVSLGEGDTWWSTRLFLLASLLRSLTPVRQLVFTGRGGRFAGMASPSALLDGMGAQFRVLDAFARQLRVGQPSEDRWREIDRQIDTWNTIFGQPRAVGRTSPPPPIDPVTIPDVVLPASEQETQVGVREELLQGWLGERLINRCIRVQGRMSMSQVQQIVDCLVPDVPLEILSAIDQSADAVRPAEVNAGAAKKTAATKKSARPPKIDQSRNAAESNQIEIKVIDRDAFALELAREWVRTGLPRNPAL